MHTDSTPPPPPTWDDQVPLVLDLALADLAAGCEVLPTLIAFRGDDPLFLATLRPFTKGDHEDPVLEVAALASGLGADRLLLSLTGRAWSLADPIAPVVPGGPDLRQRVIVVHRVDATVADPVCLSTIVPVTVTEDAVEVGDPLSDIAGEGWVPRTLLSLATMPHEQRLPTVEVAALLVRCERLGHRLSWASTAAARITDLRTGWCQ